MGNVDEVDTVSVVFFYYEISDKFAKMLAFIMGDFDFVSGFEFLCDF